VCFVRSRYSKLYLPFPLLQTPTASQIARVSASFTTSNALTSAKSFVGTALRLAARSEREVSDTTAAFTAAGLDAVLATDIARAAAAAHDTILRGATSRAPGAGSRLASLRWRTDIVISHAGVARVLRATPTIEITTSDGRIVAFEVPLEKLGELRHAAARAVQEMAALEGHAVLQIQ
jgi:hypothetical protein